MTKKTLHFKPHWDLSQKFSCKLPQFHSRCNLTEINLSENLQIFLIPNLFDSFFIFDYIKIHHRMNF